MTNYCIDMDQRNNKKTLVIKWVKVHRVKVRKIKLPLIKRVDDVENILIIGQKDFVRAVVLGGLLNCASPRGGTVTTHLMEIKAFIDDILNNKEAKIFLLNILDFKIT